MRILFATKSHLPTIGGAEMTTHWLACELRRRGHAVAVYALPDPLQPHLPALDDSLGYPTARRGDLERTLATALEHFAPDVAVVGGYHDLMRDWARRMLTDAARLPTVLHLHDVAAVPLATESELQIDRVIAVSAYLAGLVRERGGLAASVPPAVGCRSYRVRSTRRVALFVNPVAQKGLETAAALARARPDVPFAFTRCWQLSSRGRARLRAAVRGLGNVEIRPSTPHPAALYGDARVVLVPSPYPESWGRVAAEAQVSAIPVLATRIGGLPEAVGDGGVLLDPQAGTDAWVQALSRLWDDDDAYRRQVGLAERHAMRRDLEPRTLGARFEALLYDAVTAPIAQPAARLEARG